MLNRGHQIKADRRMAYFLGFSLTCMIAGIIGVFNGYMLFESMPKMISLCLIFLVPIYFGLLMSNTIHPPFLLAFVSGCLLGPPMHLLTQEWGLLLSGLISGSLEFMLRNWLKGSGNIKEVNGWFISMDLFPICSFCYLCLSFYRCNDKPPYRS